MKFDGDIIIIDPTYFVKSEDWGSMFDFYEYKINNKEFSDYLWSNTGVGDWSWNVLKVDVDNLDEWINQLNKNNSSNCPNEDDLLGKVSVDSGTFGVFYRRDILKYLPQFETKVPSSVYTRLDNFCGDIDFKVCGGLNSGFPKFKVIKGNGIIKFYTEPV